MPSGIYKRTKKHCLIISETRKKFYANGGIHPKGMLGKRAWNKGMVGIFLGEKAMNWQGGKTLQKDYFVHLENKRRSLKFNNGGSHSLQEWEDLKKKWGYMCLCCKKCEPEIKLTEDHILPLSKGGRNDIQNIQPLCMDCNRRKNAKFINYIDLYESKMA